MLLAEELALVAIKPDSGRHELGTRDQLNACLAGLLVAELLLDGLRRPRRPRRPHRAGARAAPHSRPTLAGGGRGGGREGARR